MAHKAFGNVPTVVIVLAASATAIVLAQQVVSDPEPGTSTSGTSATSIPPTGASTAPGPLPTMTPTGPAWIVAPTTLPASSTVPGGGSSVASTVPGQSGTTSPGSPGTAPQLTTTTDYPRFNCTVTVSLFAGERTGDLRRVKVAVNLSTNEVPSVWVETRWDENSEVNAVSLNPTGSVEFLVYAPGNDWPTARVFASSDLRASSQMCSG